VAKPERQGDPNAKTCRWCSMPRRIHKGAFWCPECDERADLRAEPAQEEEA
jgi:uncharacterized Zn finger protein (UPF0148 family)